MKESQAKSLQLRCNEVVKLTDDDHTRGVSIPSNVKPKGVEGAELLHL